MKFSRYLTFGMQIIHGLEFSCFYQKNIFLAQILMIWLFCSLCSLCGVLLVITLIFFPSLLKFLPFAIVTSSALCALFAFVDFLFLYIYLITPRCCYETLSREFTSGTGERWFGCAMDSFICRLPLLTTIASFIGAIVWLLLLVIQSALQNYLERYRIVWKNPIMAMAKWPHEDFLLLEKSKTWRNKKPRSRFLKSFCKPPAL